MQTPIAHAHQNGTVIEDNPVGLPNGVTGQVVPALDRHVASLFVLFHQYQKHHWIVEGPQFRDLHLYLEEAYTEIHQDLDAMAERITVLGGLPTSSPRALAERAYIEHEAEGEPDVRRMLEADLAGEQAIIKHLRDTIKLTMKLEDFGSERLLKKSLYHAEERAHHLDHYLQRNTLVSEEC
ncbi:MAG: DNA starvation/stationary phase protection protein DpsA [Bacteroidota bacterium]